MLLLKKEFWDFSFEIFRMYGMDILRRLHVKGNMKEQKLITIQVIEICEVEWHKTISFLRLTYMLYKAGCRFLPHASKCSHKLQTPTKQVESNVRSLIDLCANTMPHQFKGIKNGRYDV
jgi:hypothetical protein